jgi:hypothetical protein
VPAAPARYRKKREDGAVAVEDPDVRDGEAIDPLDAQNAGLHEAAIEQGHEEITLNLDEFDEPAQRAAGEEEPKP